MKKRTETDSLGEVEVPADALYGSHTERASRQKITNETLPPRFIAAVAHVKLGAARANQDLGNLKQDLADAIAEAAREIIEGKHGKHFILNAYQTGSGTSTNMNVNEVVANRAAQLLGKPVGEKAVHPNDHVNMSQSSNDVIPTATHVAALLAVRDDLLPSLKRLETGLSGKARETMDVVKPGRTHLQDAAPITLGQEFSGYAAQVSAAAGAVERNAEELNEVALGGTAVGTGLNAPDDFAEKAITHINEETGLNLREAENHFAAQASHAPLVQLSGTLRRTAAAIVKISNDLRLLVSGPRTAIHELSQPETQPGSSIMPGKINPVVPEAVVQACAQVHGLDTAIAYNGAGELELNLMKPLMARNILKQAELLTDSATALNTFIDGLEPNPERCEDLANKTLALATALNTAIGYDEAADVAKEALRTGKTLVEVVVERGLMDEDEAKDLLDPASMI